MSVKRKLHGSRTTTQSIGIGFRPSEWNGEPYVLLWSNSVWQLGFDGDEKTPRSTLSLRSWDPNGAESFRGDTCIECDLQGTPVRCEWIANPSGNSVASPTKRKHSKKLKNDQLNEVPINLNKVVVIPTTTRKIYVLDIEKRSLISKIDCEYDILDLCLKEWGNATNFWICPKSVKNTLFEIDIRTGLIVDSLKVEKSPVKIASFVGRSNLTTSILAVGAEKIYVYNPKDKYLIKKLNGHANKIMQLEFTPNGRYILSTSANDNAIYIWSAIDDLNSDPICILPTSVPLLSFCINRIPSGNTTSTNSFPNTIASVGTDGLIYVWKNEDISFLFSEGDDEKYDPKHPTVVNHEFTIAVQTRRINQGQKPIQHALSSASFSNAGLVVSRNMGTEVLFEKIPYSSSYSGYVVIERAPLYDEKVKSKKSDDGGNNVEIFDSADVDSPVKKMKDLRVTSNLSLDVTPDLSQLQKIAVNGTPVANGISKFKKKSQKKSQSEGHLVDTIELSHKVEQKNSSSNEVESVSHNPVNESTILHALTQAVLKNDEDLVLSYMCSVKKQSVNATIRKLDTKVTLSLFTILLSILRHKPSKYTVTVRWLRELMFCHASYLASIPDIESYLGKLNNVLKTRAGLMSKLLNLSARLDVMVLNIRAVNENTSGVENTQENGNSALVSISDADLCGSSDNESVESESSELENASDSS